MKLKKIDGEILRGSKKRRNEKINEKEELQEAFENYMNLKDKYDKDYVLRINLKDFLRYREEVIWRFSLIIKRRTRVKS